MKNNNTTNTTDGVQAATSSPQAQAANLEPQAGEKSSENQPSLEALQREIADLRKENASYRKRAKEQEEAARLAEDQRLKEQGQYKQLAEQYQARVNELEPISERYNQLASLLASQIESETKNWPDEIKVFDPGADAPIEERLAWIEKSKPLVAKLEQQGRAGLPGNAPNPKPTGQSHKSEAITTSLMRSGLYNF